MNTTSTHTEHDTDHAVAREREAICAFLQEQSRWHESEAKRCALVTTAKMHNDMREALLDSAYRIRAGAHHEGKS